VEEDCFIFTDGSQPLAQSSYHGLLVLLQIWAGQGGHFGALPQPLWHQLAKTDHVGV